MPLRCQRAEASTSRSVVEMAKTASASRTGTERVTIQISMPASKQGSIRTPALAASGALPNQLGFPAEF